MNEIFESDRINGEEKKVEIGLKIIGPSPPSRLSVPSSIKVYLSLSLLVFKYVCVSLYIS